ncbi:polyketide cyclase [Mycolicibacterium sp. P9-64]|uniref:SRPBCC family protein n=1 Tax=Mycolicibacterium sp. P9-64 TaxID=2024612 RepID=UPI0011EDBECF|nr:SRPBCC family protein [Mycolicibacterium sp. P9-64]KAA0080137.1 polyketide cyclase [Mycolicibacterium sp. P9-64]
MPTVTRTMTVAAPPERLVEYLKDFANAEDWDSGTQRCTRNDTGPIKVGSSWHNVSKVFGVTAELTYTLEELTRQTLVFVGTNARSTSRDTITITGVDAGSLVTYRAELTMHGLAKLLNPIMKLAFDKLADDTEKQMTKVLNALGSRER